MLRSLVSATTLVGLSLGLANFLHTAVWRAAVDQATPLYRDVYLNAGDPGEPCCPPWQLFASGYWSALLAAACALLLGRVYRLLFVERQRRADQVYRWASAAHHIATVADPAAISVAQLFDAAELDPRRALRTAWLSGSGVLCLTGLLASATAMVHALRCAVDDQQTHWPLLVAVALNLLVHAVHCLFIQFDNDALDQHLLRLQQIRQHAFDLHHSRSIQSQSIQSQSIQSQSIQSQSIQSQSIQSQSTQSQTTQSQTTQSQSIQSQSIQSQSTQSQSNQSTIRRVLMKVLYWYVRFVAAVWRLSSALVWTLIVVLLLLGYVGGSGYLSFMAAQRTAAWPQSDGVTAQLVDTGDGTRLHLLCTAVFNAGDQATVTVLFEAGTAYSSAAWEWLLRDFNASYFSTGGTRVAVPFRLCAYDRAGYGWSDARPSSAGADVLSLAGQLDRLLTSAALPPPYLLVGWSFGALVAEAYACQWPERVRGLLLVDPTPADVSHTVPGFAALLDAGLQSFRLLQWLQPSGVVAAMQRLHAYPAEAGGPPEPPPPEHCSAGRQLAWQRTQLAVQRPYLACSVPQELASWLLSERQVLQCRSGRRALADIPRVVIATDGSADERAGQQRTAQVARSHRFVIMPTDHYVPYRDIDETSRALKSLFKLAALTF